MATKFHWIKNEWCGNYFLEGDRFFISYRKEPRDHPLADILRKFNKIIGERDGPETALVIRNGKGDHNKFLILHGDWREEYEKVWPVMEDCIEFYRKLIKARPELKHEWGDEL